MFFFVTYRTYKDGTKIFQNRKLFVIAHEQECELSFKKKTNKSILNDTFRSPTKFDI